MKRHLAKSHNVRESLLAQLANCKYTLRESWASYTPRMDLTQFVEHHGGISVIRGGETVREWNGIRYQPGLSAKNVNARHLSMNVATVPPGGVAYAHVHVGFEVMLYILSGRVRHEFGAHLKQSVDNAAGDFIYIEPGVPHEVFNLSDTEPVVAVVARSDADEWAHIVTYDRETGATGGVTG